MILLSQDRATSFMKSLHTGNTSTEFLWGSGLMKYTDKTWKVILKLKFSKDFWTWLWETLLTVWMRLTRNMKHTNSSKTKPKQENSHRNSNVVQSSILILFKQHFTSALQTSNLSENCRNGVLPPFTRKPSSSILWNYSITFFILLLTQPASWQIGS